MTARERIGYVNDRELAVLQRKKTALDTLRGLVHHYRGAIAGACCGLGMAMGPSDRETKKTLALFMFIRAFEMEVKIWVEKGWVPNIPNADVLLMSLSSAQILWAWIFEPSANDPFYQTFLDRHGQKPRPVVDFINDLSRGLPMDVQVSFCPSTPPPVTNGFSPFKPPCVTALVNLWTTGPCNARFFRRPSTAVARGMAFRCCQPASAPWHTCTTQSWSMRSSTHGSKALVSCRG
jgi:hypothetical protein